MRTFRGIMAIVAIIGLLAGWLISPQRAFACSCMAPGTPAQELSNAAAVFAGEVKDIQTISLLNPGQPVRVTFKVSESWKGPVQDTMMVETSGSGASCGFEFAVGQQYLVYAHGIGSQLNASICSRTALLSAASQDLVDLGQGTVPTVTAKPSALGQVPILIGLCGVMVLLTVVGAYFGYRRLTRRSG